MIKLAIFDMDGLMIDSEPLAIQGWKEAARQQNIQIPDELYPKLIGLNRDLCKTVMQECLGHSFDFETALTILHSSVDNHIKIHGLSLKPGLTHILDKLDEVGIKKCVATSTVTDRAIYKLERANIVHRFDTIIGGDQVPHSKPAPDIFLKAAQICKTNPAQCVVLEDSNAGAKGGDLAGMHVIVVPDLDPPTKTTQDQVFAICNDLYQACDAILSINCTN